MGSRWQRKRNVMLKTFHDWQQHGFLKGLKRLYSAEPLTTHQASATRGMHDCDRYTSDVLSIEDGRTDQQLLEASMG
jgi:hypothetical protein